MPFPFLPVLSGISAGAGLIGSLFSREGPTQEHDDMMAFLRQEYEGAGGIDPSVIEKMRQRLKMGLSNEALAAATQLRQTGERTGAGGAAERAGQGRLQSARLAALGEGLLQADIASEQIRQQQRSQALNAMTRLASMYPAQEQTGEVFGSLLGLGMYGLQQFGQGGGQRTTPPFGGGVNQYTNQSDYPGQMFFRTGFRG